MSVSSLSLLQASSTLLNPATQVKIIRGAELFNMDKPVCQPEKKKTAISWSQLPGELLPSIGKGLESRIDILHFRAVCHSWRSSISLSQKSPPLPLRLQFHIEDSVNPLATFLISQTTVYHLEPDFETLKTSPNKGCLIKVQEPKDGGKMRALDLFSTLPTNQLPDSFPRVLNLLNSHVSEISRAFKLQKTMNVDDDVEDDEARLYKVVLSSNFESSKMVLAIKGGDLCSIEVGNEENWVLLDKDVVYRDIVNYHGRFYAVDSFGVTVVLDNPSLAINDLVLPPKRFNGDWHFITSCGDLFLVARDFHMFRDKVYFYKTNDAFVKEDIDIPVVFKVYTLSDGDDQRYKWREVNSLGDRAFFVSYHCSFSVLARDVAGCKANCIYFVDGIESIEYIPNNDSDREDDYDAVFKELDDWKVCVFNLEDGSSGPLTSYPSCSNIFWPPSAWLSSNPSSSGCRMFSIQW